MKLCDTCGGYVHPQFPYQRKCVCAPEPHKFERQHVRRMRRRSESNPNVRPLFYKDET